MLTNLLQRKITMAFLRCDDTNSINFYLGVIFISYQMTSRLYPLHCPNFLKQTLNQTISVSITYFKEEWNPTGNVFLDFKNKCKCLCGIIFFNALSKTVELLFELIFQICTAQLSWRNIDIFSQEIPGQISGPDIFHSVAKLQLI